MQGFCFAVFRGPMLGLRDCTLIFSIEIPLCSLLLVTRHCVRSAFIGQGNVNVKAFLYGIDAQTLRRTAQVLLNFCFRRLSNDIPHFAFVIIITRFCFIVL